MIKDEGEWGFNSLSLTNQVGILPKQLFLSQELPLCHNCSAEQEKIKELCTKNYRFCLKSRLTPSEAPADLWTHWWVNPGWSLSAWRRDGEWIWSHSSLTSHPSFDTKWTVGKKHLANTTCICFYVSNTHSRLSSQGQYEIQDLAHRFEGIEPPTLWLVDDPLYLLFTDNKHPPGEFSNHASMVQICEWKMSGHMCWKKKGYQAFAWRTFFLLL